MRNFSRGTLGGNKLRGSTGGRPWFGGRNDIRLAPAICGAICTGRCHAVNRTSPVSAQPTAQTVGGHDRLGGERWRGAGVREERGEWIQSCAHVGKVSEFSTGRCRCGWGVSPVPVQMWEGLCRCEVGDRFSPGADEGGVEPSPSADVRRGEPIQSSDDVAGMSPVPVQVQFWDR